MFSRNLWPRLLHIMLYTLIAQCVLGFVVWGLAWNELQLGAQPTATPSESDFLPKLTGRLETSVRNIFGDPVPGASFHIDNRTTIADRDGTVSISDLPIGLHQFTVHADGYQDYDHRIRINEGINVPIIKYDQGLWPIGFAVDFHVFHAYEAQDEQKVFFQVGLANGSDQPVYIRAFYTLDATLQPADTLLSTPEGYRRLSLMHTALSLATEPYALVLKPWGIVHIELPPIVRRPVSEGPFYLIVHYGNKSAHERRSYVMLEVVAEIQHEPDLSPHRP